MNLKICLFFLLCSFSPVIAQDGKWSLGLGFSPDFCYRTLRANSPNFGTSLSLQNRNGRERIKLGYTTGIRVRYEWSPVIHLETGLLYSIKGYASHFEAIFGDQIDSTATGFVGTSMVHQLIHFKYLDIPLKVNMVLTRSEKKSLHFTSGFNVNVFLEQKNVTYITRDDQPDEKFTSYGGNSNKSLNISTFIGIGLDVKISERIHANLEPIYRFGIFPAYNNDSIRTHLWTSGLNFILYYRL